MTQPSSSLQRDDAVFALYDGDFHIGLGALVNSLYRAGFHGIVYVGYRGQLPPWARPSTAQDGVVHYDVAAGCAIRFIKVDFAGHLTNSKPRFIKTTIETFCPDVRRAFYFDVDIVVKCPWAFFQHWADCGIAVCKDINEPQMSGNHPLRGYWRDMAARLGYSCREYDGYFNGGFVGMVRENLPLLTVWQRLIDQLGTDGIALDGLTYAPRPHPAQNLDQDMLNVALMATSYALSPVENSNMDMAPGGYVMAHALSGRKPWRQWYILDALRGYPPTLAHKAFWTAVERPIRLYSDRQRRARRACMILASAIGRFYGRR
jgi:hypothetical protein